MQINAFKIVIPKRALLLGDMSVDHGAMVAAIRLVAAFALEERPVQTAIAFRTVCQNLIKNVMEIIYIGIIHAA